MVERRSCKAKVVSSSLTGGSGGTLILMKSGRPVFVSCGFWFDSVKWGHSVLRCAYGHPAIGGNILPGTVMAASIKIGVGWPDSGDKGKESYRARR